jgi:Spy/CpxP family protein refolding chaperone
MVYSPVLRRVLEDFAMIVRYLRSVLVVAAVLTAAAGIVRAQDEGSLLDQLNLTTAQKEQIQKLRDQFKSETEPIRTAITQLQKEVRQLKSANPVNENALRAKLKQQADKEIELSLAITRFQERVEGLLTPDQKKLLKKLQSK